VVLVSFVRATDGLRISFDQLGRSGAEPLVMIQGLGATRGGWSMQRIPFATRFRTIALDNRGVGRSDKPRDDYDLVQMADDVVSVLDECGVESAHVMGASMGGAIAQLVAVRHPERVRSMVLACTACRHHDWRRELLAEWASIALDRGMGELAKRTMPWLIGQRSLRRFAPMFAIAGPLATSAPSYAFAGQVRAILDMDDESAREQLRDVRVPTLVVVGSQDILTPRGDSEELAEMIPGAELVVVTGAAHGLMVEHATTFNRVVGDFLARASVAA
jgi:3-oxoadipate enol-lactonase